MTTSNIEPKTIINMWIDDLHQTKNYIKRFVKYHHVDSWTNYVTAIYVGIKSFSVHVPDSLQWNATCGSNCNTEVTDTLTAHFHSNRLKKELHVGLQQWIQMWCNWPIHDYTSPKKKIIVTKKKLHFALLNENVSTTPIPPKITTPEDLHIFWSNKN